MSQGLRLGESVMERLATLARYSETPDNLTRRYLTAAHKQAASQVTSWMEAAGMSAGLDAVGNVVGRYESEPPGAPALLLGSHIDTVVDAGPYDGNLGVIAAIACVGDLAARGRRLPFAIEVLAFGDEEGSRFPATLTGSSAIAGRFDPACLDSRDEAGVSLGEALQAFGGDPAAAPSVGRAPGAVHAYVELHIEQGPVLESKGLPVGVVTAINGANRFAIRLAGMAGHAGTVPMALRRDALAGAAEMMVAVEEIGGGGDGLVATVGRIEALPGSVNVVPGEARFTLDVRAPEDAVRRRAASDILARFHDIAERRGLDLTVEETHDAAAAACAPWIMRQLDAAVAKQGIRPLRLPSGAGHDAMAFSGFCPMGMLFQRCTGGISHNPAESITVEDTDIAVRVLLDFIENFEPDA